MLSEITVPIPNSWPLFLYFSIIPNITGIYADKGVIMSIAESEILYPICAAAGDMPTIANIGTKTGAKSIHFVEPLVINMFTIPHNRMKRSTKGIPDIFICCRASAPFIAIIVEILLLPNHVTNIEAGKHTTRNPATPTKLFCKNLATSAPDFTEPVALPYAIPTDMKNENNINSILLTSGELGNILPSALLKKPFLGTVNNNNS